MRRFLTALIPATLRSNTRLPGHEVYLQFAVNWKMLFSLCAAHADYGKGIPQDLQEQNLVLPFMLGFSSSGLINLHLKNIFFPPKSKGKKWSMSSSKLDSDGLEIQHRPAVLWAADLMGFGSPWANLVWILLGVHSWKLWLQFFLWGRYSWHLSSSQLSWCSIRA